jgi:hypothetical protein
MSEEFKKKVHLRGVLGNKCAGQNNLKTVHFRETLASDNFWHAHQQYVYFFAVLYLPHTQKNFRNACYQVGFCTGFISTGVIQVLKMIRCIA